MKKIFLLSHCLVNISYFSFSQNIGIGTTTPARAKLEVHAAPGTTAAIFGGEGTGISLRADWPAIGFNEYYNFSLGNKYIASGFAANLYLNTSTGMMGYLMIPSGATDATISGYTEALMIGNNGNIGIKTNPANASLYVIRAGNIGGSAIFGGTNYSSYFHYSTNEDTYIRAGKASSNVYINDLLNARIIIGSGSSYVGINTSSPAYALEVRQTGATGIIQVEPAETFNNWEQVVGLYEGGPQSSLKWNYNGQLRHFFRPTDGELIHVSDRRLKTNIRHLTLILDKIMQLRPVEYEVDNDPNHKKHIGFLPQEVKQVFPELATLSSDAIIKDTATAYLEALNYDAFIIIAVKGVQEEQIRIRNLQSRQIEITRRLEAVEKKLASKN